MTDRNPDGPRLVTARRVSALTGLAALATAGVISSSGAQAEGAGAADERILLAQAEGEGEGEAHAAGTYEGEGGGEGEGAASIDPDTEFLSGLAFMEGHIRAGLALYRQGDLEAAKTHMGHPIEEKYDAVADGVAEAGFADLKDRISGLADAAEAEVDFSEIEQRFAEVRATLEAVRGDFSPAQQVAGLIDLTRTAGAEYAAAIEDGRISNLHEYQDSWGFLQVVETEARQMAESDDAKVAEVGRKMLEQVDVTRAAYGDLQGDGTFKLDPSILYGAAARMEIAGADLSRDEDAGEAEAEGEGESG